MTTDPTPLQERIARAIHKDELDGEWAELLDVYRMEYLATAAAVLPIIREAQADAAREALDGYADALNRNRSAAVWDWPDFVGDVREWASYNYPETEDQT